MIYCQIPSGFSAHQYSVSVLWLCRYTFYNYTEMFVHDYNKTFKFALLKLQHNNIYEYHNKQKQDCQYGVFQMYEVWPCS